MWFFHWQTSKNEIQAMHWNCCYSIWMEKESYYSYSQKGGKQMLKINIQCRCYLFVEKFLKDYCLTKRLIFLLKINLFYEISPVLNRVTISLISCYLSLMTYMSLWDWSFRRLPWYMLFLYKQHFYKQRQTEMG